MQPTMYRHQAQVDARRLLKKIAGAASEKSDQSSRRGPQGDREHTDILSKKYEELGRLLALQHLENNVLSSVSRMRVQFRSQRPTGRKKKQGRIISIPRNSATESERCLEISDHIGLRPHRLHLELLGGETCNEDEEMGRNDTPRRRHRPKSSRVKSSKSDNQMNSRRTSQTKTSSTSARQSDITESQLLQGRISGDEERDERDLGPYELRNYYKDNDAVNTGVEFCGLPDFVIAEVTETVMDKKQSEATKNPSYSKSNSNDVRIGQKNPRRTTRAKKDSKTKKHVTFCGNSTKDNSSQEQRVDTPPFGEQLCSNSSDNSETNSPLHVILENEILMELLESPRPGHFLRDVSSKTTKLRTKPKKSLRKKRSPPNSSHIHSAMNSISPRRTDHKLEETNNTAIKSWLKKKKKVIRQQKRAERNEERMKRLTEEKEMAEKMERSVESEKKVAEWQRNKKKDIMHKVRAKMLERKAKNESEEIENGSRRRTGDNEIIEETMNTESSNMKEDTQLKKVQTRIRRRNVGGVRKGSGAKTGGDGFLREALITKKGVRQKVVVENRGRKAITSSDGNEKSTQRDGDSKLIGERIENESCQTKKKKVKMRKSKRSRVAPAVDGDHARLGKTDHLKKKVSYDEWLEKKRIGDKQARVQQQKLSPDSELDDIIPFLARQRLSRVTKRSTHPEEIKPSDLPESDQSPQNPFTLLSENEASWLESLGTSRFPDKRRRNADRFRSRSKTEKVSVMTSDGTSPTIELDHRESDEQCVGIQQSFKALYTRYAWDGGRVNEEGGDSSTGEPGGLCRNENEGVFITEST